MFARFHLYYLKMSNNNSCLFWWNRMIFYIFRCVEKSWWIKTDILSCLFVCFIRTGCIEQKVSPHKQFEIVAVVSLNYVFEPIKRMSRNLSRLKMWYDRGHSQQIEQIVRIFSVKSNLIFNYTEMMTHICYVWNGIYFRY